MPFFYAYNQISLDSGLLWAITIGAVCWHYTDIGATEAPQAIGAGRAVSCWVTLLPRSVCVGSCAVCSVCWLSRLLSVSRLAWVCCGCLLVAACRVLACCMLWVLTVAGIAYCFVRCWLLWLLCVSGVGWLLAASPLRTPSLCMYPL